MPALGSAPRDGRAAGVLTVQFRGRREKVRVATAASTLQNVVEDACEVFGAKLGLVLDPTRSHLVHRGKKLDASLPFRFTGLVNNALVDLQTAVVRQAADAESKRENLAETATSATPAPAPPASAPRAGAASTVHVQVRFPNGKAFRGKFAPETSLAAILENAGADAAVGTALAEATSEIVFMQNKVARDALRDTTLRALGLTSGSAALRANVSAPQERTAAPEKPSPAPSPAQTQNKATVDNNNDDDTGMERPDPDADADMKVEDDTGGKAPEQPMDTEEAADALETPAAPKRPSRRKSIVEAVAGIRNAYFDEDSRSIVQTLLKIIATVVRKPSNERVRRINQSNAAFQEKVGKFAAAVKVLQAVGFVSRNGAWVLPVGDADEGKDEGALISESDERALRLAVDRLADLAIQVGCSPFDVTSLSQLPAPLATQQQQQQQAQDEAEMAADFDPYKTSLTRLAPQLPVKPVESAVERELADLRAARDKLLASAGTPDRQTRVFKPEGGFNARNFSAHLEATRAQSGAGDGTGASAGGAGKSDLGLIAAAAKARQQQRAAEEKFSTRAMRELEALRKAKVYTSALLRVQLPDRVIVQAYFSPQEKVSAVYTTLADLFLEPLRADFELYVSPPQRTLLKQKSLEAEGLVPAALVHLRWLAPSPPTAYLRDPSCILSSDGTEALASKMEIEAPALPTSTSVASHANASKQQQKQASSSSSSSTASDAGFGTSGGATGAQARTKAPGKPKWMKLG